MRSIAPNKLRRTWLGLYRGVIVWCIFVSVNLTGPKSLSEWYELNIDVLMVFNFVLDRFNRSQYFVSLFMNRKLIFYFQMWNANETCYTWRESLCHCLPSIFPGQIFIQLFLFSCCWNKTCLYLSRKPVIDRLVFQLLLLNRKFRCTEMCINTLEKEHKKIKIKTHCTYTRVCVFLYDFTKFLVTQFLICLFICRCKFCFVCCSYALFLCLLFQKNVFCIHRSVCVFFFSILRQSWLFCGQCLFFSYVHFDVLVAVCFQTVYYKLKICWVIS